LGTERLVAFDLLHGWRETKLAKELVGTLSCHGANLMGLGSLDLICKLSVWEEIQSLEIPQCRIIGIDYHSSYGVPL